MDVGNRCCRSRKFVSVINNDGADWEGADGEKGREREKREVFLNPRLFSQLETVAATNWSTAAQHIRFQFRESGIYHVWFILNFRGEINLLLQFVLVFNYVGLNSWGCWFFTVTYFFFSLVHTTSIAFVLKKGICVYCISKDDPKKLSMSIFFIQQHPTVAILAPWAEPTKKSVLRLFYNGCLL